MGVCARRGERLSEEIVAATLADFISNRRVDDRICRQRQRDDTVAAVDGLQRVGIGTRCGEDLPEEVVAAAVANSRRDGDVIDGVHRQGQRDDAVAAVDRLQCVGVGARRGQVLSEEVVAVTLADFRYDWDVIDGVDRQC